MPMQEASCLSRSATRYCVGFSNSWPCAFGRMTSKSWKLSSSGTNSLFCVDRVRVPH